MRRDRQQFAQGTYAAASNRRGTATFEALGRAKIPAWLAPTDGDSVSAAKSLADQLVKDPMCGTYIVRSRAVTRAREGRDHYFCSARCAEQFVLERG